MDALTIRSMFWYIVEDCWLTPLRLSDLLCSNRSATTHNALREFEMIRRRSPLIEELEGRTLLSSLQYTLTSDRSVYQVGQPINLVFTETNTSNQAVTADVSPVDFTISQSGASVWESNPANNNQPPTSESLLPGQSVSQSVSWNGTGTFSSGGGFQRPRPINFFGTFVVTNPNAPPGLTATFQITDPLTHSLTTDQSVYALGEPIQITDTELNTSTQPITVAPDPPAGFSIMHNGVPVLTASLPQLASTTPVTIQPGQSVTATQTWDGIPLSGPYTFGNLTGTFDVGYGPAANPTQSTTTFQISPPSPGALVTNVTTDKLVYEIGQPVSIAVTETNNGAQPVSVLTGPTEFEVTQNGTSVWTPTPPNGAQPTWMTLQHGQSYNTQTATWDSSGATTGTFAVSDPFDPSGSSATFQIVSPPNPGGSNPNPGQPSPSPSPIKGTRSTGRHTFKLGQRVPLSLVLKNVSTSNVAIRPKLSAETVVVTMGSTVVYQSARKARGHVLQTVKPGHTLKLTTAWSGKANQTGIKNLSPGTYTITVDEDGYGASTTVKLIARHKNVGR
jgi:hypothetical protein